MSQKSEVAPLLPSKAPLPSGKAPLLPGKASGAHPEFAELLQECLSPDGQFHHWGHVKLGWLHLKKYPLLEALSRFGSGLKHFAESHGAAAKYHETLTIGYLLLIQERMTGSNDLDWESFACRNPDLLDWKDSLLKQLYSHQVLWSEQARSRFVLPDKVV